MERKYQFKRSLGMLSRQISKGLGIVMQECLRKEGRNISPVVWTVISYLRNNPSSSQQDIVNFLWINKVKVKRVLDILESENLIKREISNEDRRYNKVKLTPEGIKFYDSTVDCAVDALSTAFKGFSEEEERALIEMLLRIKSNLSQ